MNSKTSKLCRKFSSAFKLHNRTTKRDWNRTPHTGRNALRGMMQNDIEIQAAKASA